MSTQEQPQPHPESFGENIGKTDDDFRVMVTMFRRHLRAEQNPQEGMYGPDSWGTIEMLVPDARKAWGQEEVPWIELVKAVGKMAQ